MTTVYLVCKTIDLGVHPIVGFYKEEKAIAHMDALTALEKDRLKVGLISGCRYTLEQAQEFVNRTFPYEIWEVEIQE